MKITPHTGRWFVISAIILGVMAGVYLLKVFRAEPGKANQAPLPTSSLSVNAQVPGEPLATAKQFLTANATRYALTSDLSDLKLIGVTAGQAVIHVRFQQTYKDIPVYGNYVTVHLDSKRTHPATVTSQYDAFIQLTNMSASVDSRTALSKAMTAASVTGRLAGQVQSDLVVYPHGRTGKNSEYVLAWDILIPAIQPAGDWEVFVDASTADILDKFNRRVIENKPSTSSPASL